MYAHACGGLRLMSGVILSETGSPYHTQSALMRQLSLGIARLYPPELNYRYPDHTGSGDLSSSPHACMTSALTTEPLSPSLSFLKVLNM